MKAQMDSDCTLTVEVIDNGRGIEDIEEARKPFFTSLEAPSAAAWGLPSWRALWTN
jgi:anti-sigma regulatory factor (Ser/Thr protein kinase)